MGNDALKAENRLIRPVTIDCGGTEQIVEIALAGPFAFVRR